MLKKAKIFQNDDMLKNVKNFQNCVENDDYYYKVMTRTAEQARS